MGNWRGLFEKLARARADQLVLYRPTLPRTCKGRKRRKRRKPPPPTVLLVALLLLLALGRRCPALSLGLGPRLALLLLFLARLGSALALGGWLLLGLLRVGNDLDALVVVLRISPVDRWPESVRGGRRRAVVGRGGRQAMAGGAVVATAAAAAAAAAVTASAA